MTAIFWTRGRSFSFADLDNQTCNAKEYKRVSKKLTVCNHRHHLPSQGSANRLPYIAAPRVPSGTCSFYQKRRLVSISAARLGGFFLTLCRGPGRSRPWTWADTCTCRPRHRGTAGRPSPPSRRGTWAGYRPSPSRGCTAPARPASGQRR